MLADLIKHAEASGLSAEPGFAPKELHYLAHITSGRLTGVLPLKDGKKGMSYPTCPQMGQPEMMTLRKVLGQTQAAHFLADTCGVIALLPDLDKDQKPKTDAKSLENYEKNVGKHPAFIELLRRASKEVPQLEAVNTLLSSPESLEELRIELIRQGAKPSEKISFNVDGTNLIDSNLWHDWWRNFRSESFGQSESVTNGMLDFTTGQLVIPIPINPLINPRPPVKEGISFDALRVLHEAFTLKR